MGFCSGGVRYVSGTSDMSPERSVRHLSGQNNLRDPSIIDNTVTMMRFDRVDGSGVIATIVHWGNHPEMTMWDTQASADFPGVLRSRLEAAYPGSVGVFLQGSVGDQITGEDATFHYDGVLYADEEGPWTNGSFEKAAAMGNYLADIVLDTLETSGIRQENCGITSADHLEIYAAIDNPEVLSAAGLIGAVLVDADGKPLTEGEPAHVRDEVAHIAVCDLEILTNPSEVGPELVIGCYDGGCANPDASLLSADNPTSHLTVFPDGPFWKDYMTARFRMVTSLTNGLTGYLVDPATWMLDPVDPWGFWTVHHYDETASFSVKNAAIIDRAYRELLGIEPVPSPGGIDVPKAVLNRYVGNYADRMQVSRDDAQLVASLPRFGTSVELLAVSENRIRRPQPWPGNRIHARRGRPSDRGQGSYARRRPRRDGGTELRLSQPSKGVRPQPADQPGVTSTNRCDGVETGWIRVPAETQGSHQSPRTQSRCGDSGDPPSRDPLIDNGFLSRFKRRTWVIGHRRALPHIPLHISRPRRSLRPSRSGWEG